jgi:protein-L-isoaspartate(D-aspartate) O-methyltransferase
MLANDSDTARFNMIEQQIRPWEVIDDRVLSTLKTLPREHFVDDEYKRLAYADIAVPIGEGQAMMKPVQEGRMLQALNVQPGDQVLEIGTGSGFTAACLASLGGIVTSYEIHGTLSEKAAKRLADIKIGNVELVVGDGLSASLAPASFDVIAVTGSMPVYAEHLEQLLKPGGRLFVVVGEAPAMQALLISHAAEGGRWQESLFETVLPPLENAPQADHFVF